MLVVFSKDQNSSRLEQLMDLHLRQKEKLQLEDKLSFQIRHLNTLKVNSMRVKRSFQPMVINSI
jgi:hypothetical protein